MVYLKQTVWVPQVDDDQLLFYSIESRIEFIVTESEEEEIILINRHDFYYDNDQCSGDIGLEIMSNYSVVQNAKRGNEYIELYSI